MDRLRTTNKLLLFCAMLIVGIGISMYFLQGYIVRMAFSKVSTRIENRYNLQISNDDLAALGLGYYRLNGLRISSNDGRLEVVSDSIKIKIRIPPLILFRIQPKEIHIHTLDISLMESRTSELHPHTSPNASSNIQLTSLNQEVSEMLSSIEFPTKRISKVARFIGGLEGSRVGIYNFSVHRNETTIHFPFLSYNGNEIGGELTTTVGNVRNRIELKGYANSRRNELGVKLTNTSAERMTRGLSYLLDFDTLYVTTKWIENKYDSIDMQVSSHVIGLTVAHPSIADNPLHVKYSTLKLGIALQPSRMALDSTSFIRLNSLSIPFEGYVSLNRGLPHLSLKAHTDTIDSKDLFESIPDGLFQQLRGVRAGGQVSFEVDLDADLSNPDSLRIHIELLPIKFQLHSTGTLNLSALTEPFKHHIVFGRDTIKTIHIDSTSRNYRSLDAISPYLINSVVAAEDGGFFHHKGFAPDGFQYAMARNLKEGRLTRGGSTITMQLVKNLYLTHSKNLSRKAEEAMIVWLIETQRIISKRRILEIYLNIIEWGPNINGIAEASYFYFKKDPIDLQLNEAIFLASIVPRPNHYRHSFDSTGNLREHMVGYYQNIGSILFERGHITKEELDGLIPSVSLQGSAKNHINSIGIENDIETSIEPEPNLTL